MNVHSPNEGNRHVVAVWFSWCVADRANDLVSAVAHEYEPLRDLKTLVSNAWSTNPISTFAYTYDAIGRRTVRIDDSSTTDLFGYNPRSEFVSAPEDDDGGAGQDGSASKRESWRTASAGSANFESRYSV